jgi:hypothetical protein
VLQFQRTSKLCGSATSAGWDLNIIIRELSNERLQAINAGQPHNYIGISPAALRARPVIPGSKWAGRVDLGKCGRRNHQQAYNNQNGNKCNFAIHEVLPLQNMKVLQLK